MKTRKFPFYVSVAFLALTGVFAFGQEVSPAQAPAQPAQAVQAVEQPAPATAPAPASTPAPAPAPQAAQPAAEPEQPAPQAVQPAQAIEQPAPAVAPITEPAAPAPAPVQPAAAPVQPAAIPAQPEQPVQAPAPSYEAPREAYIQGYGQPPQGFFGYYGYAPCEKKECVCDNAEPTVKKKKKRAQEPEEAEDEPEKEKNFKILHSFHVSIPIESEKYDFKKDHFKVDASHFGVGGNWNRIRVDEGLYSSVVGIGFNYIMSEWDGGGSRNLDYNGLDVNLKFGFGVAPVREKFILAIHAFFGFDYKMLQAEFKADLSNMFDDMDGISMNGNAMDFGDLGLDYKITHTMHSLDIVLGGDLIMAYQITDHFGVMAGIDISSNMVGGGVLLAETKMPQGLSALANIGNYDDHGDHGSYDNYDNYDDYDDFKDGGGDEISPILYFVSGINIVPRIGIFFTF